MMNLLFNFSIRNLLIVCQMTFNYFSMLIEHILIFTNIMSQPSKKIKINPSEEKQRQPNFSKLYDRLIANNKEIKQHPFTPLIQVYKSSQHPILQVIQPQNEVYKTNPQKKKKSIEIYLDTVNTIYKKKDLQILINPITPINVFEKWAPRQVAIFEEAIIKFGKQFEFIAELIGTKNPKDVYEFYLQWKTSSHFRSYKTYMASINRSNLQDMI